MSTLFKPFNQIMPNRNLNNDGVGLGLSVCLNLAQAMNGQIKVTSKMYCGSVFKLMLPVKRIRVQP